MPEIAENVVLVLAKIKRFLGGNGHAPRIQRFKIHSKLAYRIFYVKDLRGTV